MSTEYRELAKRIRIASDSETIKRLDRSLSNIWNAGFLTVAEFGRLSVKIMEKEAEINILSDDKQIA